MTRWTGPVHPVPGLAAVAGREEITRTLLHAVAIGASDVIFQTGEPVFAKVNGALVAITPWWLQPAALGRIAASLTQSESILSRLYGGQDYDCAVAVEDAGALDAQGERVRHRFRVNVTAGLYESDTGLQIVCRHIPHTPPRWRDIDLEPEIVAASTPEAGMVMVAGQTGSGKTTTLAALIRRVIEEDTPLAGNIVTYESPIEFVYGAIASAGSLLHQNEIGLHLPTFAAGVRNCLRRTPDLILIGELRDLETIMAGVEAANTGCTIYATTHANDCATILRRLALKAPAEHQDQTFHDALGATRLLAAQTLVPRVGGGRHCLREWQVINEPVRREVSRAGMAHAAEILRAIIARGEGGRSMQQSILLAWRQGLIEEATARRNLLRYGYDDELPS